MGIEKKKTFKVLKSCSNMSNPVLMFTLFFCKDYVDFAVFSFCEQLLVGIITGTLLILVDFSVVQISNGFSFSSV